MTAHSTPSSPSCAPPTHHLISSGAKQQPATTVYAPTPPAPAPHKSPRPPPPPPVPIDTSWKASSRFRVPPGPTSVCKSPPPPEPPPPPKPTAPAPPVRRSLHCQHPAPTCAQRHPHHSRERTGARNGECKERKVQERKEQDLRQRAGASESGRVSACAKMMEAREAHMIITSEPIQTRTHTDTHTHTNARGDSGHSEAENADTRVVHART
jgi:hypothetical protein